MATGTVVSRKRPSVRFDNVELDNRPADKWLHDPDLSALDSVDPKHWKVVGETVVAMDQGEQDTVDADELAVNKKDRAEFARDTTRVVRNAGFEHPAASGKFFPLNEQNQIDWLAAAEFGNAIPYPFTVFTVECEPIEVANQGELNQYRAAATGASMTILGAEAVVLAAIWNAADQAALDSVVDNRT
jgi:hypothetical protein